MTTREPNFAFEERSRQSVMDVQQRNRLESVQSDVRRNNSQLTALRRENKELKAALVQAQRGQRELDMEGHYEREEELLHNRMAVLKRSINAVKGKNAELQADIDKTAEEIKVVDADANGGLDENSPTAQKIRSLENRLDKCLIKYNEISAIKRTYETLLQRLQLEQAGFDTQVAATDKNLAAAAKELQALQEVGKEAAKTRDAARAEAARLKAQFAAARREQKKDLETRRGFLQSRRDALQTRHDELLIQMTQQEERHSRQMQAVLNNTNNSTNNNNKKRGLRSGAASAALSPEEEARLQTLREQYSRLREATAATGGVAEVIKKYNERRGNHEQLRQTAAELESKVAEATAEKQKLQAKWDALNAKAGGALVAAKVVRRARDEHNKQRGGAGADGNNNNNNNSNANEGESNAMDNNANDNNNGALSAAYANDFRLLGDRRHDNNNIILEFEKHLAEKQQELSQTLSQQKMLSLLLTAVENGVNSFGEKMQVVRPEEATYATFNSSSNNNNNNNPYSPSSASSPLNNSSQNNNNNNSSVKGGVATVPKTKDPAVVADNCIDVMRTCDARLQILLEDLTEEDITAAAEALRKNRVIIPETNVRLPEVVAAQQQKQWIQQQLNNNNNEAVWGGAGGGTAALLSPKHSGGGANNNNNESGGEGGVAGLPSSYENNNNNNMNNMNKDRQEADDFPENEIRDRRELKMMSAAAVEREVKKEKKRQTQRKKSTV